MSNLLNLKIVIDTVKSNEDDDGIPRYQEHKLMNTLERSVIFLIMLHKSLKESFLASSNNTATCLMARKDLTWMSIQTREIAFYSMLLVFLIATSREVLTAKNMLAKKILASGDCHCWWKCLIDHEMEILAPITEDEITESFLAIVRYGLKYFKMISVDVLEFWPKILKLRWKPSIEASVVNY